MTTSTQLYYRFIRSMVSNILLVYKSNNEQYYGQKRIVFVKSFIQLSDDDNLTQQQLDQKYGIQMYTHTWYISTEKQKQYCITIQQAKEVKKEQFTIDTIDVSQFQAAVALFLLEDEQ